MKYKDENMEYSVGHEDYYEDDMNFDNENDGEEMYDGMKQDENRDGQKYDEYEDEMKYDVYKEPHKKERKRLIEVEKVVGFGKAETTVEVCIPLCPPAFEVVEELISKKIVFDALVAGKNKVFVNGRLIKDIPFKTRNKEAVPGCERISRLTFGDVRHVTAEIPFALCIDVPGAEKGDKVVVLKADVESLEIPNHLRCEPKKCVPFCEPAVLKMDTCMRRLFKSITEKDCIEVKVKVVKPTIICMPEMEKECCEE